MLALVGDASDNIPGVPKVGQKTAAKWLMEFKNLEGIKSNAELIKGVVGENLRNSLNELDRNIELVSLKEDVDIGVSFESLLEFNANQEKLDELFSELEFKPMAKNSSKQSPSQIRHQMIFKKRVMIIVIITMKLFSLKKILKIGLKN